jgi:hypothetical protein
LYYLHACFCEVCKVWWLFIIYRWH